MRRRGIDVSLTDEMMIDGMEPGEPIESDLPEDTPEHEKVEGKQFLALALSGENLVDYLEADARERLALDVVRGFEIDEQSMEAWEKNAKKGRQLASMIAEGRVDPWPGAADHTYPLILSACLQFNARAYPSIVPPGSPLKIKTFGKDAQGLKAARAARVEEFTAHQLNGPVRWNAGIDAMLLRLPAVGTVWRKIYHDPVKGLRAENRERVVFNNYARDLESMPRISEEFGLYPHEIQSRIRSGRFIEWEWKGLSGGSTDEDNDDEYIETDDEMAPHYFVEQLRREDLDEDGYDEPYVVTVHRPTGKVVRVVANFGPEDITIEGDQIISIKAREYYVAYRFWPSFDGTFAGIGFGMLLGNVSDRINGILNLVTDSAHLSSLGGGFLGLGLNLKGGPIRIRPGEWKPVQSGGSTVRDAMVPLQFPGPSAVLFQVLGLLIDSGKEVASLSEVMTGDVQRQQTATTTLALIEQGMAVFTSVYKRIFESLRREFTLICGINKETINPELYQRFHDVIDDQGQPVPLDPAVDFDLADLDIAPVADPREVTNMQRMGKAELVMQLASQGMLDPSAAVIRVLEAAGIEGVEDLMPQPDPMADQMQQMQMFVQQEMISLGLTKQALENEKLASEIEENRAQAIDALASSQTTREGEAQAMDGARFDRLLRTIETLSKVRSDAAAARANAGNPAGMAGPAGNPSAVPGVAPGGPAPQAPDLSGLLVGGAGQPGPSQGPGAGGSGGLPF